MTNHPYNIPPSDYFELEDPQVAKIIQAEEDRQLNTIELIASENFASDKVRAAQGSILTNKYAEGYPGKRYYGGCVNIDTAESLAIQRACDIFHCQFANVQPHSGSQANMAVYYALLKPGDTILSMELSHGGHLTHGSPVSFSGRQFNIIHYPLDRETERINYDVIESLAKEHKPQLILCGASAYSRIIDFERIGNIARMVNSVSMADIAHIAGLVVSGHHPSPLPHIDVVTSTTHKTLRGPRGGLILSQNGEYMEKINKTIFPGIQGGPLEHVILAKAVAFGEAMRGDFQVYMHKVVQNAKAFASAMESEGWRIISGGTDNHLFLIDLRSHNIKGKWAQDALDAVNITANRNSIPYDPNPPYNPSGMRFGTPAMTTLGFRTCAFRETAELITDTLLKRRLQEEIREDVAKLIEAQTN